MPTKEVPRCMLGALKLGQVRKLCETDSDKQVVPMLAQIKMHTV